MKLALKKLLQAHPSIQVSTLLSGSLTTPSAKSAFVTNSYESISSTLVGSGGQSTITFSSIPATYTHLQIRVHAQSNRATYSRDEWRLTFNGDSGANYSWHGFYGNMTTASGTGGTSQNHILGQDILGANGFWGNAIIDIHDYANTNKYKTVKFLGGLDTNNAGVSGFNGAIDMYGGNWRSASAITSISFVPSSGTLFSEYSRFSLYGIKDS